MKFKKLIVLHLYMPIIVDIQTHYENPGTDSRTKDYLQERLSP